MMQSRGLMAVAGLVALLQIGFLAWMIQGRASVLRDGTEVLISVAPVDPRDLLRGDYVALAYNISTVNLTAFEPPLESQESERPVAVMVRLAPGADGVWNAQAARLAAAPAPTLAPNEVEIAGVMPFGYSLASGTARVDYGIERFYLPEGEGVEIERDLNTRSFFMKVAVARSGAAQIKAFYDGDRQLYAEPFY